jgi:putative ABC transport system substrate-binding protein
VAWRPGRSPPARSGRTARAGSAAQNDPEAQLRAKALEAGLRELGWVEGRNLRLDYRWVPNADRLGAQAGELVGLAPDLIVAVGTPVVAGLLPLSRSLPIVFVGVTDQGR